MSRSAWAVVARHLEAVAHTGTLAACSDADLLDRFRDHRDEAAFAALVQAHGPMVRAVCRRIVADPHRADDAFQASFLVLARRAGSVRDAERLGPWLHRVAVRVATRAVQDDRRRRRREVADSALVGSAQAPLGPDPDRARLLHEELDRLPERYRLPVLLCDLQRLTHEEAASRLRWPVGTVKGRLSRARDRLRDRLTRRGLATPLTLIAATLATDAQAVLPAALAARTASVALSTLTGSAATVTATAAALALSQGVRPTMWFAPLKLTALAALLGGGLIATQAPGPRPPAQDPARPAPVDPAPAADPVGPERNADVVASPILEPIAPDEREEFQHQLELVSLDEEFLEDELERTRESISELSRAIRGNLIRRIQESTESEPEAARLKALTGRLTEELQQAQAQYRKRIESRREIVQRKAQIRRRLEAPSTETVRFKPGDTVRLEVLGAPEDRPLTGLRRVQPDGTISLGFYGDLRIAGLDRRQAKAALVQHMQTYLDDEALGLTGFQEDQPSRRRAPEDSDRCLLTEASADSLKPPAGAAAADRIDALERRLDEVLRKLDRLQPGGSGLPNGFESGGGGGLEEGGGGAGGGGFKGGGGGGFR